MNALKRQLRPQETACSKKRAELLLATEMNLTTSSGKKNRIPGILISGLQTGYSAYT
jgi:hypothetical protein